MNEQLDPPGVSGKKSLSPIQVVVVLSAAAGIAALTYWLAMPGSVKNITGTVTRSGKPLVATGEGERLHVIFVPEVRRADELPTRAECDAASGTFRIGEIRRGKYRLAVHLFDERHMDALGNKFDPGNSPIRGDVATSNQVIDIHLP